MWKFQSTTYIKVVSYGGTKFNMSNTLILENVGYFSKQDHHWWTLFGDKTHSYDPETLTYVSSYNDAYFKEGMGIIKGWRLSVEEKRWDIRYHYILAECDEDTSPPHEDFAAVIKVKKAIWLPIHHWCPFDSYLRENNLDDYEKKTVITTVKLLKELL